MDWMWMSSMKRAMMNNVIWHQGKLLRRNLAETRPNYGVSQLAVVMILMAREQGLDLADVVHQLILANHFVPAPTDKDEIKRQLGF